YKERADEYRYFPEPDLPILEISRDYVEQVRTKLPELPDAKRQRLIEQLGLSEYDARVLVMDQDVSHYYEDVLGAGADPKQAANWILTNLFALMNKAGVEREALAEGNIPAANLAELVKMVGSGAINNNTAVSVLAKMWDSGEKASVIVEREGLAQVSDTSAIAAVVDQVIGENPDLVQKYLDGNEKMLQALFGPVMKAMKGKGNPQTIREILQERLDSKR